MRAAALGNTLAALVARDAEAYAAVAAALQVARRDADAAKRRRRRRSTRRSSPPPTSRSRRRAPAPQVAELALAVAERGNTNAASDAGVAALLAEAGCVGASYNVRINVVALSDRSLGAALELEARQLVAKADEFAQKAPRRWKGCWQRSELIAFGTLFCARLASRAPNAWCFTRRRGQGAESTENCPGRKDFPPDR